VTAGNLELARAQYQAGKAAFDRGQYRQSVTCLEEAANLAGRFSPLGGEVQLFLVTAYQAAGQQNEAIALGEQLTQHPDLKIRKQSRRLVYILKAPQLKLRPEWQTQIPDLSKLDNPDSETQIASRYAAAAKSAPPRPRPQPTPEPIDLSQVNTRDNGFVWIALVAIALIIGGLIWLS
jgi:tetratricopeptide (TPR) repeat protein